MIARFENYAVMQDSAEPRKMAEMLYLLLEGVWATTRMFIADAPIGYAKEAARRFVR